ncbi:MULTISPECIES: DUF2270 domain-containing protein [Halorubrum]|uniref:DUF2270 domain-containing protein n=1 Tax=Halorubrum ezzemoulense TaxID=337243 RepID=A0A256KC20_HALEZ|nr:MULTISPECIES: DUF2270 domain-containing protein [Halorubrum]OYR75310.1 hypothetical protein DJ76_02730 [Halorubrum ezzemoulense]OYR77695.1 hypothetical protein DJ77_03990 [Halorubrum ezzemoulense]OYR78724.1 hypothetical protein DJ84_20415 [Halorubrum ezzemoulense]PHQ42514.1 hypothetical protein Z052_08865 [Halorubrum sp. C191]QAY20707.1 DUF2270 domain-containing protein [Halorubrum ezzemoulense]
MSEPSEDFDPESREEREVAAEAAGDRSDFLSLMGHAYRGELGRTSSWRTRIDRTTNWAVVVTASLLTWTFSSASRPHYVLLIGLVMLSVFLGIETRRYRTFDVWRSRVRLLEENVFANALDPEGVEQSNWRALLSEDLREPTIKMPAVEAVSRRLRRVYAPLVSVLVAAWVVRLTVFTTAGNGVVATASVGPIPGALVLALVGGFYVVVIALTVRRAPRRAKGEMQAAEDAEEWK